MIKKIIASVLPLILLSGCATMFRSYHADTLSVDSVGKDKALSFKILDQDGATCGRFSLDHDCEVVICERGLIDENVIPGQIDYVKYARRDTSSGSGTLVIKLKEHPALDVCTISDSDWKRIVDFTKDWVGFGVFISE